MAIYILLLSAAVARAQVVVDPLNFAEALNQPPDINLAEALTQTQGVNNLLQVAPPVKSNVKPSELLAESSVQVAQLQLIASQHSGIPIKFSKLQHRADGTTVAMSTQDGICSGEPVRTIRRVRTLFDCQQLCLLDEDCMYVSYAAIFTKHLERTHDCNEFGMRGCENILPNPTRKHGNATSEEIETAHFQSFIKYLDFDYTILPGQGYCKNGLRHMTEDVPTQEYCRILCSDDTDCVFVSYDMRGHSCRLYDGDSGMGRERCDEAGLIPAPNTRYSTWEKKLIRAASESRHDATGKLGLGELLANLAI